MVRKRFENQAKSMLKLRDGDERPTSSVVVERFLTHVARPDSSDPKACWTWTGCVSRRYGRFKLNGRMVRAHRYSFLVFRGPTAELLRLEIDHLCGNKLCVRPSHLEPVTHQVNMERLRLSGRAKRARR